MNIILNLKSGLKKTSDFLSGNIVNTIKLKKINQDIINEIEEILLSSDIGLDVTNQLIKKIKSLKISDTEDLQLILKIFANEVESILKPREKSLITASDISPTILLFIGVNSSGKTTTIGKLIHTISENKKILIGACDTFRAAAVDQLKEWTNRKNVEFFQHFNRKIMNNVLDWKNCK